jgi:hypothetical protein
LSGKLSLVVGGGSKVWRRGQALEAVASSKRSKALEAAASSGGSGRKELEREGNATITIMIMMIMVDSIQSHGASAAVGRVKRDG